MKRARLLVTVCVVLALLLPLLATTAFATPANWNDPNFKIVWERTDKPVQDGVTARSWMWGPETVPGSPGTEPYAETPGGTRVVQYFDKSRMEVNNPAGDRSQLWFVTNGLLVREMVSGNIQMGNNSYQNHGASGEAVAGDPANLNVSSPTYATFQNIASLNNNNPAPQKSGPVQEHIDKAGNITQGPGADPGVAYASFEGTLKHNIPNVFWDFMRQSGPVFWNSAISNDVVIDWTFAMGLPISEPYWTKAMVGGVERDVLVQLFERRVLTYTPTNTPGFRVEMGNVGQHYYRWRYQGGGAPQPPAGTERIAFASNREAGNVDIWTMNTSGGDLKRLTDHAAADNWPSWSPNNSKIVFASNRDGNWEIYVMGADGSNETRLTNDAGNVDTWPTWSRDGNFISWTKGTQVWVMTATGGSPTQLSPGPAANVMAIASPDGQSLVWASSAGGNADLWKARLDLTGGLVQLTNDPALDLPTDWQGNKILYVSAPPGGVPALWAMNDDGTNKTTLLAGGMRGAYSPNGGKIVVQKDNEIFVMNNDGSGAQNITNNAGQDVEPDWSN